jgi:hypothetical protein
MRSILKLLKNNDLIEIADALGDMMYILYCYNNRAQLQGKVEAVF